MKKCGVNLKLLGVIIMTTLMTLLMCQVMLAQNVSIGYQQQEYDDPSKGLSGGIDGVTFDVDFPVTYKFNMLLGGSVVTSSLNEENPVYSTNPFAKHIEPKGLQFTGRVGLVYYPNHSIMNIAGIIGLGAINIDTLDDTKLTATAEVRLTIAKFLNLNGGFDIHGEYLWGFGIRFPVGNYRNRGYCPGF